MSSFHKNIFQCECSPKHNFETVEEFNRHFSGIHHKYFECSSKTLFQDYMQMKTQVGKIKEERDMWKHLYQEEVMKDTFV